MNRTFIWKAWDRFSLHIVSLATVALIVAIALAPFPVSGANTWYRISLDPEQPRADKRITVKVQTLLQEDNLCLDEIDFEPTPVEITLYRDFHSDSSMEVRAIGPNGQRHHFDVHKSEDDASIWKGSTTFPEPGKWSLVLITVRSESTHLPVPDPCLGTAVLLTVLPAEGTPIATPAATPA